MPDKDEGPLTEADFAEIKGRLEDLDRAQRMTDQAVRAGIEVGDAPKQITELRDKLTRMRQTYFPGRM